MFRHPTNVVFSSNPRLRLHRKRLVRKEKRGKSARQMGQSKSSSQKDRGIYGIDWQVAIIMQPSAPNNVTVHTVNENTKRTMDACRRSCTSILPFLLLLYFKPLVQVLSSKMATEKLAQPNTPALQEPSDTRGIGW